MKLAPALLFVITVHHLDPSVEAKRLQIGGKDTGICLYPYMAAIEFAQKLVGNGAIVAQRYILTSASAVAKPHDSLYKVQLGADAFKGPGDLYEVHTIYKHPQYIGWDYNIALVHLKERIRYSDSVQPCCWFRTAPMSTKGTMHLRDAIYTTSTDAECVDSLTKGLSKEIIIQEHGFCVRSPPGAEQGQWADDAGAPIVADGKLYGVFAFSEQEGKTNVGSIASNTITIFTRSTGLSIAKHDRLNPARKAGEPRRHRALVRTALVLSKGKHGVQLTVGHERCPCIIEPLALLRARRWNQAESMMLPDHLLRLVLLQQPHTVVVVRDERVGGAAQMGRAVFVLTVRQHRSIVDRLRLGRGDRNGLHRVTEHYLTAHLYQRHVVVPTDKLGMAEDALHLVLRGRSEEVLRTRRNAVLTVRRVKDGTGRGEHPARCKNRPIADDDRSLEQNTDHKRVLDD
uniref:Peptidase S1 domain-containing protein n=1 Tax=Anopheles merus TaxID=30066 RepID=A0A182UXN0_ANOME